MLLTRAALPMRAFLSKLRQKPQAPDVPPSARDPEIQPSVDARALLADDFFGGWRPEDAALFRAHTPASVAPASGMVVDFLGVRTRIDLVPWATAHDGRRIAAPPIPNDSIRAEAIEFFALLSAIEAARSDRFVLVEVGAAYAPWICAAGVVARRRGMSQIRLVAVEASPTLAALMPVHLADNGLSAILGQTATTNDTTITLVQGAVWTEDTTLYFPKTQDNGDNGGQATDSAVSVDYIGRTVESLPVQAWTLARLIDGIDVVDLLHVDIQGSEAMVIPANVELLRTRVKRLFVGTHSRWIEGLVMKTMYEAGWVLERERPCQFTYIAQKPSLEGMTTRDGGQVWMNPALNGG